MTAKGQKFSLAYYSGDRKTGSIAIVNLENGQYSVDRIPQGAAAGKEKSLTPILLGVTPGHKAVLLDPKTKQLSLGAQFTPDAFAAHIYSDPKSNRDWFMNDGDKETGNDTLNCGDKGSSVTVVENSGSESARYLATICVGRGHHQANFSYPSDNAPNVPRAAYISNLQDGTVSVIGNDPANADDYLKVVATINLCEPEKEKDPNCSVPNNAFPHGLVYSSHNGKIYNLNNGYGTVAVIDPVSNTIEKRFGFKGHSNLFITQNGRYVIGRGADRKSDPNHVIANLTVLDTENDEVRDTMKLQDVYISKYFFNPEGTRLYLTTSSSGSPEQEANLKKDAVLVFDLRALPTLKLEAEIRLGSPSGTLEFYQENNKTRYVYSSNAADGELVVIDADSNTIVERIQVGEAQSHSRIWAIKA